MRLHALLGAVLLAALLPACGGEECRSGEVPAVLMLRPAAGDLPAELGYSSQDLRDAITGTWSDAAAGLALDLEPDPALTITYSIAAEGTACMTMTSLPLRGELRGTEALAVRGEFLTFGQLESGSVELYEGVSCSLSYAGATDTAAATLTGDCDLTAAGLGPLHLALTRAP